MAKLLLGRVAGPQGPQGTAGADGAQGPQGPQGIAGPSEITAATDVVGLTSGRLLYNNGGKLGSVEIVDDLTSTATDKPLSANKGRVLKDYVDSAIGQAAIQKNGTKTTTFNPDGSITEVTKVGSTTVRTKTTTFPSATQIIETTVENGITTVKTTTFNPDGTITEGVV